VADTVHPDFGVSRARQENHKPTDLRGTISVKGVEVVSHNEPGDVSIGLKNLIVGTNQIVIKLDRNPETSIHQEKATGTLNVLVLRDSSAS